MLRGDSSAKGRGGLAGPVVAVGFEPFQVMEAVLGFAAICSLRRAGGVSEAGQGRARCCGGAAPAAQGMRYSIPSSFRAAAGPHQPSRSRLWGTAGTPRPGGWGALGALPPACAVMQWDSTDQGAEKRGFSPSQFQNKTEAIIFCGIYYGRSQSFGAAGERDSHAAVVRGHCAEPSAGEGGRDCCSCVGALPQGPLRLPRPLGLPLLAASTPSPDSHSLPSPTIFRLSFFSSLP